ncbi:2-amino-4-hydroxy-6-hydroxymethyldihydropteridine diphosphokinase [bacterium]|nr:2-amino-4-hydroxy-6-hydroxymethyldihydropteridine diphosphokinase [bacterium]
MESTNEIYLLLGTNLGNRFDNLQQAKERLDDYFGQPGCMSSVYETAAWGKTDQPGFLNAAVVYKSANEPRAILSAINAIEADLGRERFEKWGPRLIDIDILFVGNEVVATQDLKIPHPEVQNRRFALEPMHELAAGFIHPLLQKNIAQLLQLCSDTLSVRKVSEIENTL